MAKTTEKQELVNHDTSSVLTEEKFIQMMEQREANTIRLGAKIASKEIVEGGEKKDKDGNPIIDGNGIVQRYPSTYYVDLTFDGGSIRTSVQSALFSTLEENKRYLCIGRLGNVRVFGKEQIMPIFTEFTKLMG